MLIEKWEWKRLGGPRDRECDSPFEGARKSGCGGTLTNKRVFLTILATEGERMKGKISVRIILLINLEVLHGSSPLKTFGALCWAFYL